MAIQDFKDKLTKQLFGTTKGEAATTNTCVICKKPALEFDDSISIKEYHISGLCQQCQDSIFNPSS